jgi:hemin uptake protein HemP
MDQKPPAKDTAPPVPIALREIDSNSLLQGEKEILIRHSGEVYRLRLTKNDKLILQK